jgi:flagellar biosynthesis protein FlhG
MSDKLSTSRILAITSGKGGVGKTFVSANLAAALAKRGRRVLVLDADLGLANLDIMLKLYPKTTLHDVLTGASTLKETVLKAPGGFSVLPAASGLVEYSRLTRDVQDEMQQIIDSLSCQYDYLILDTGAGISDIVLYTASLASEVLVVATPDPTALADAYATIKVLAQMQKRTSVHLVFNQVRSAVEGRKLAEQLQLVVDRFINAQPGIIVKLNYLGEIPTDVAVSNAIRKRQLLFVSTPDAPSAQAIAALAAVLDAPAKAPLSATDRRVNHPHPSASSTRTH